MKLAFSTLGCPDWTMSEILSTAKDLGFDGVEIRGIGNEVYAPEAKPFLPENLQKTSSYIKSKDIPISLFATGVQLGRPELLEKNIFEAEQYFVIAKALDVKFMRVMITNHPYPEQDDYKSAVEAYSQICDKAKDFGVCPLIETNGTLAKSSLMKQFIQDAASDNSGVLWDIHHPYRYFDEKVSETFSNIGEFIKYVHVKDSLNVNGNVVYKMLSYGDVPVYDAVRMLNENGYTSCISLEWVKRWHPDLEDGGIVFSHFVNYMNTIV